MSKTLMHKSKLELAVYVSSGLTAVLAAEGMGVPLPLPVIPGINYLALLSGVGALSLLYLNAKRPAGRANDLLAAAVVLLLVITILRVIPST